MASTSKRLHGPAQVNGSPGVTKYTVPALTKTRVRHVHLFNPSGAPVTFTMSIGADGAGTRLFDAFSIPAGAAYDWYPFAVLDAAEVIQAFAGTANVLVLTIFGDELTLG
jgi:hypothetical protein